MSDIRDQEHGQRPELRGASGTLPAWAPQCIYLYYLNLTEPDHAEVQAFLVDERRTIDDRSVDRIIDDRISEIRAGDFSNVVRIGRFIGQAAWTRQSYLAFVLDDIAINFELHNIDFENSCHTLLNKEPIASSLPHISGVRFRNYVLRRGGVGWNRRKLDEEHYRVAVTFGSIPAVAHHRLLTHEDSGTNLGPPVPPP